MARPEIVDLAPRPSRPRLATFAARPQSVRVDLNRAAVVIIDVQNDFCSPGGWFDSKGIDLSAARSVFDPINRLTAAARGALIPIVWLNWGNRPDLLNVHHGIVRKGKQKVDDVGYGEQLPGRRGRVLERGSWGAAIVRELTVLPGDVHVAKYRFSGFWDNEFDTILRKLGVSTLLVGGVNLDRCVLSTIQDGSFAGFDSVLVEDCSATSSPEFCVQASHFLIERLYGFIATSRDVAAALSRHRVKQARTATVRRPARS